MKWKSCDWLYFNRFAPWATAHQWPLRVEKCCLSSFLIKYHQFPLKAGLLLKTHFLPWNLKQYLSYGFEPTAGDCAARLQDIMLAVNVKWLTFISGVGGECRWSCYSQQGWQTTDWILWRTRGDIGSHFCSDQNRLSLMGNHTIFIWDRGDNDRYFKPNHERVKTRKK